ncbi:hypothetical protein HDU76_010175 [Blyttiomyces sp. JEL0837]|nr:hypothetical protein HDU76_010175 [Blyttiomyces sp. JEL0837]
MSYENGFYCNDDGTPTHFDDTTIPSNPGLTQDDFSQLTQSRMTAAGDLACEFAELNPQTRQSTDSARFSHEFQVGDYALLAAPLRTRHTSEGILSEKFQYPWVGPVCIVGIHGTDSQSSIDIVQTYPGYEIALRTVLISHLQPYTCLKPEDNTELATLDPQPDIENEIQQWNDARLLRPKPRGEQPTDTGLHRCMMQALYPDFTSKDIVNPEFRINHIVKFRKISDKYEYLTKWDGWTHWFNTWQKESDMHPDLISEFWDTKCTSQPHQFELRQSWLRKQKKPQAPRAVTNKDQQP